MTPDIQSGNAGRVFLRSHHHSAGVLLQGQIAAGMIQMMMGVEDMGQRPAPLRQGRMDRPRFGRVHHRAGLARLHQIGVIVAQAGDDFDFDIGLRGHGNSLDWAGYQRLR